MDVQNVIKPSVDARQVHQNSLDSQATGRGFGYCHVQNDAIESIRGKLRQVLRSRKKRAGAGNLDKIWSKFDNDHNGELDRNEFTELIQWLAPNELNHANLQTLLRKMDTNGNGMVSQEEFVAYVYQKPEEVPGQMGGRAWT